MPCYHPLLAFRSTEKNPETGKRGIVFNPSKGGYQDLPVKLPCGQCIGCRLERSRKWAIRCMHESQMHEDNSFITLTFNDDHLCKDGSLHTDDFQRFMKRLRKFISPKKVRFYHCGEYGDKNQRPHHHACLFGYQFPDLELWKTVNGVPLYTSEILSQLWPYGYNVVGEVTFESAAYVARYIMKKQTGESGADYYGIRKPPYTTMSRKPGLGATWYEKYKNDIYPHDFVVTNKGQKVKPPPYYDKLLEKSDTITFDIIKNNRLKKALDAELDENNSLPRLNVREKVKQHQLTKLPRIL